MKIFEFTVDDWSGIYLDGSLVEEGHSARWDQVIPQLVGHTIESYERSAYEHDEAFEEHFGRCPQTLDELKETLKI